MANGTLSVCITEFLEVRLSVSPKAPGCPVCSEHLLPPSLSPKHDESGGQGHLLEILGKSQGLDSSGTEERAILRNGEI